MKPSEKWAYLADFTVDDIELIDEPLSATKDLLVEVAQLEEENERLKEANEHYGSGHRFWIAREELDGYLGSVTLRYRAETPEERQALFEIDDALKE